MTDTTLSPQPEIAGRSLAQLAMMRFRRNKAAMAGCFALLLICIFSFAGPLFVPHTYDQVFASYVTVPPSLSPRPDPESLQDRQRARRNGRLLHFLLRFRHLNLTETIFAQSIIVKKTSQPAMRRMVAVSFTFRMCNMAGKTISPSSPPARR